MRSNVAPPSRCLLCNAGTRIKDAGFRQLFIQKGLAPVSLNWWACSNCHGWFAYPVADPEVIKRHWPTVDWADANQEAEISIAKESLFRKILVGLSDLTSPGLLLDDGCGYGRFLVMAHEAGWSPYGFDPNEEAVKIALTKGEFDVRCGWDLAEANFSQGAFSAITAVDSFYYAWDPSATLQVYHRLLKPGGVLVMRTSNKRLIMGLIRTFFKKGPKLNSRLSRILRAQFHSVYLREFTRILERAGFDRICIDPRAASAPWSSLKWRTRGAYFLADVVRFLTLRRINLSPAAIVFAVKAQ